MALTFGTKLGPYEIQSSLGGVAARGRILENQNADEDDETRGGCRGDRKH
jgi:hypothetical protein